MRHAALPFAAAALSALLLSACGPAAGSHSAPQEAWNMDNDPLWLAGDLGRQFAQLPLTGEIDQKPWTDTYWPSYQGGIARRWNDPSNPNAFSSHLYTKTELQSLPPERISQLSPAEKYDLLVGDYTYHLTWNQRVTNHATDPLWFGFCHGWAPATLNYKEPKPVTLKSPDGLSIAFGSSDVKALLLYAQQYKRPPSATRFLGVRCDYDIHADPTHANDDACRDTNAGSFHVALTNFIGVKKVGLIADVSRDIQVWNQPVYAFSSVVNSQSDTVYPGAAPGTVKIVEVTTLMKYVTEFGPRWQPSPFNDFPAQQAVGTYHYDLELNAAGDIIGGQWLDDNRPDFMWTQTAPQLKPDDYLGQVQTIYDASIAQ